jgi:hypothetical protein
MEVLVATATGAIINIQPNGTRWGLMEDYASYIDALRDPEQWHGRLCLIRVPDMPFADGERFQGGTISLDWIAAHGPAETLAAWEFDMIAEARDGD